MVSRGADEGELADDLLRAIEGEDEDSSSEYGWTEDCERGEVDWGEEGLLDESHSPLELEDGAEGIEELPADVNGDDETDLPSMGDTDDEGLAGPEIEPLVIPERLPPLGEQIGSDPSS